MNRTLWIGSAASLGLAVTGLIANHHSFAQSSSEADSANFLTPTANDQLLLRNTFQNLEVVARSLVYFPQMERAIAANNPEIRTAESVFADAEVRLTGVGPLQIGMTLEAATDALGLPLVPLGSSLGGDCAYYQPDAVSQALGLMVVDNRVIRIDVWPGSTLKTVSGVHIGSTGKALQATYPGQIEAQPNAYTQGEFLTLVPQDPEFSLYRMVFETDSHDQIVQYRAGQFPAVTWPDGCV
ncbi:MAG: hypothetical protein ACFB0E_12655 [Leptolyngbyaceae cyanobacterium]